MGVRIAGPPTASDHAATKAYVDGLRELPVVIPSSTYVMPPLGAVSFTPTSFSSGTVNRQYLHPWVMAQGISETISGAVVNVTTAPVSGSGLTITVGLYASDANGYPDTTQLLRSGSATVSAVGNLTIAFGSNITLAPGGTYWVAVLYTHTSAPTTYPALSCLSNVSWVIPAASLQSTGQIRGLYHSTGRTSLKTDATANTAWSPSVNNDVPVVALKAA